MDAVIFDMDGTMIDSELFWHRATQLVFGSVGLHLTTAQCYETTGVIVNDVVALRYQQFPWKGKSTKQVETEIVDEVIRLMRTEGKPMEGVHEILKLFKGTGLPMALCSSSSMRIIDAALGRLGIAHYFDVIHSAEFEDLAKPHPAVYLSTAKFLGVDPRQCLAFEDSLTGLISAKAARMTCIAVPEHRTSKYDIADMVLDSLAEFDEKMLERFMAASAAKSG